MWLGHVVTREMDTNVLFTKFTVDEIKDIEKTTRSVIHTTRVSTIKILNFSYIGRSRFSSVSRASDSQIFWEHEFESWQPHLCNSMWGQDRLRASCQDVGTCSTISGSWGTYITFASAMRIRQPTLALKPRGGVIRNPKQGYQWPQKRTCVSAKKL